MTKPIENVKLEVNIESGNVALVENWRQELARLLREIADEVEEGSDDELISYSGLCFDHNGNNVGDWEVEITYEDIISDRDELVEMFEELIERDGFTSEGHGTVYSLEDAAELDCDALNEFWSNWVDQKISDGEVVAEASGWDWEG